LEFVAVLPVARALGAIGRAEHLVITTLISINSSGAPAPHNSQQRNSPGVVHNKITQKQNHRQSSIINESPSPLADNPQPYDPIGMLLGGQRMHWWGAK
jgi:hypothetical protein